MLVPNPFYRVGKAPFYETPPTSISSDPATMREARAADGLDEAPRRGREGCLAYVAFLDAQPQVDKARKIGTQGYCMGGALVVRTAAAVPDRIGAGASFHGGGLVTDKPDSPHLLAPKIKARMYFGVASNDDQRQPDAKDKLQEAFADAKVPVQVEVYPASTAGACPTCRARAARPSTARPKQSGHGPGSRALPGFARLVGADRRWLGSLHG